MARDGAAQGAASGHVEAERAEEVPWHDVVTAAIARAVPARILELQRVPWADVMAARAAIANAVAHESDVVMYGYPDSVLGEAFDSLDDMLDAAAKDTGNWGRVFRAMVSAVAMLSFLPRGVSFAGVWVAQHPDCADAWPATVGALRRSIGAAPP